MAFFYSFFLLFLAHNSYANQPLCIEIADRLDKKIWDIKTKDGTDLKYILKYKNFHFGFNGFFFGFN